MDRHAETSALPGDIAEQEVLEELVVSLGSQPHAVLRVDASGCFGRRVGEVEGAEIGNLELNGEGSVCVLVLDGWRDNPSKVLGQGRGQGRRPQSLEVTGAHLLLERKKELTIGVLGGEASIVEWKEERVEVRHPAKVWRRYARAHLYAVGHHGADASLGDHPIGEADSFASFHAGAGGGKLLHALGVERRSSLEAPQRLPGTGELWVVYAPRCYVGLGFHVVDRQSIEVAISPVVGRWQDRVGMVIDRRGGGDQSRKLRVDVAGDSVVGRGSRRQCLRKGAGNTDDQK